MLHYHQLLQHLESSPTFTDNWRLVVHALRLLVLLTPFAPSNGIDINVLNSLRTLPFTPFLAHFGPLVYNFNRKVSVEQRDRRVTCGVYGP